MNTIRLINKIANRVLHWEMQFPDDMPLGYLLKICIQRSMMLLRGLCTFPVRYRFMRGKRVTIRCKNKIRVGVSVTFQDEVEVDALSREVRSLSILMAKPLLRPRTHFGWECKNYSA